MAAMTWRVDRRLTNAADEYDVRNGDEVDEKASRLHGEGGTNHWRSGGKGQHPHSDQRRLNKGEVPIGQETMDKFDRRAEVNTIVVLINRGKVRMEECLQQQDA